MIVWRGERNSLMPVVEFEKETIGGALMNKKHLCVPINQRSYAWKKEHVEDLYSDLNGAIDNGHDEYFLGAVIVVVHGGKEGIEVYDGQQRLATCMMLISAIRDYFHKANDKDTAKTIASEFLSSPERKTNTQRSHFTLSAEDNQFFIDRIILGPDDPKRKSAKADPQKVSHARIEAGAKIAADHITAITKKKHATDKAKLLHRWLDFLENGARVIWVEVEDRPTAYRIFETMNDRGLKLSAADLIKTYLYSLAGKRETEVVQKWQSMTGTLESLGKEDGDLVDYIRYFWVTTHGKTRNNELFDALKNEVNSEATVARWVNKLESRANDYAAILTASHQAWIGYHKEVRAAIETIRYLGVSQIRPLLLAALGTFTKGEMEKLLKLSVNWSVRCLLSDISSNYLEDNYSKAAKGIADGALKNVRDLSKELVNLIPSDERFEAAVSVTTVQTASLARYYLRRIQMEADGKVEPQYVPNDGIAVTLEHVLPQNPGKGWSMSAIDVKTYYNRLGNQALLAGSVNSRLNNDDFKVKRPALAKSEFSLTSSIGALHQWGATEISDRQKLLASHAVKAWPLAI
jgi:hypothetical protein